MTIGVYHKGFLLYKTSDETKAWSKAQLYSKWFSSVEVRSEKREANKHTG